VDLRTVNPSWTIVMVAAPQGSTIPGAALGSSNTTGWFAGWGATGGVEYADYYQAADYVVLPPTTPVQVNGRWSIYEITRDSEGMTSIYRNGAALATGYTEGIVGLQLGGALGGGFGDFAIAELAVFSRVLSPSMQLAVEGVLCTKYALCWMLPPGHFYYVTPATPSPASASPTRPASALPSVDPSKIPLSQNPSASSLATPTVSGSGSLPAYRIPQPSPSSTSSPGLPLAYVQLVVNIATGSSGLTVDALVHARISTGYMPLQQLRVDLAAELGYQGHSILVHNVSDGLTSVSILDSNAVNSDLDRRRLAGLGAAAAANAVANAKPHRRTAPRFNARILDASSTISITVQVQVETADLDLSCGNAMCAMTQAQVL
jgi:hypothetical protein